MDKGLRFTPTSRVPTDKYRENWERIYAKKTGEVRKEGKEEKGRKSVGGLHSSDKEKA